MRNGVVPKYLTFQFKTERGYRAIDSHGYEFWQTELKAEVFVAGSVLHDPDNPSAHMDIADIQSLGCPGLSDSALGHHDVTITDIRNSNKAGVRYDEDLTDKWCVVRRGGCTPTAKYKRCVAANAAG